MKAIEKIEAEQSKLQDTDPAWMVGQQLKDICRTDPHCDKIVAEDLGAPGRSLANVAAKIKEYSDKNHGKNNCFCVPPYIAEGIIREFFGLPAAAAESEEEPKKEEDTGLLDLTQFIQL